MKREGGERGSPGARRSQGAVVSLAFAPHLGMVVSGSDDGCIRTWPLASEVRNQTLARGSRVRVSRLYAAGRLFGAEHRGRVSGLAVLGAKLASVGADRSLRLWNLEADLLPKADLMNDLNPRTDGSTVEDLARTDGSTVEDLTGSLCTTGAPVANIGAPVANLGAGRKEAAADAPSPADAPSQPGDAPSLMGETPSARSISTHVIVDAHAGELRGTAYATEISRLATAGADGTIKLWAVDEADVRPYSAHSRVGTRDGDDTLGDDTLDGDTLDGKGEGDADLNLLATPCSFGECDVFLSHSWRDKGWLKWAKLSEWCENFREINGRAPNIWLDKLCIDQKNIFEDLEYEHRFFDHHHDPS